MLTPNSSCTLYLQIGPGAYFRVYVPSCFWQETEDGANIIIPGNLPEQYKGTVREHDYVIQGERIGEITDTDGLKALMVEKPLTIGSLEHYVFGGLPHCEVTAHV